jgi:large subunit ribosomal protein L9
MQVILLERIAKLGQMGEEVRVRDGYARNFLLPRGKALRANAENRAKFEGQRVQLEARNLETKNEAQKLADKVGGQAVVLIRQAGETGQLYGSVSSRDVAEALGQAGFTVARQQVVLNTPIKTIGLHQIPVSLHPEIEVTVTANVARSAAEAERQAAGEDLTVRAEDVAFETFNPEAEEAPAAPAEAAGEEAKQD